MEIIAELEDRYDFKFPDEELPKIRTFGDVLNAVQERLRAKGAADVTAPATLAHAVECTAGNHPDHGFRFVLDEDWNESFHCFTALERETRQLAGALQHLGLRKGDRVVLALPESQAFVPLFIAGLRSGIVPVPIYPPTGLGQLSSYLDKRQAHCAALWGTHARDQLGHQADSRFCAGRLPGS